MFKFLKDFLFEENEIAVAAPPATGSITALDEHIDAGAGTEQPAGSDGPMLDKPFWNEPVPTEAAAEPVAPKTTVAPLMLDIQGKTDPAAPVLDEPLAGSPINLDDLSEPSVIEPAAPEPEAIINPEPLKDDAAAAATKIATEEEPPVMDMDPQEKPRIVEPITPPVSEPTPMKMSVPEVKIVDKEEQDLAEIDELMKKTQAEIASEEKAIAQYEADARAIEEKLSARRARMTSLQQAPNELEKAKADLQILLKNKKEVENKIVDISSKLSDGTRVTNTPPSDMPHAA